MNSDKGSACRQLNRLAQALDQQIDTLSDDEIIAEAAVLHGDAEKAARETRDLIQGVISKCGRRRLEAARRAYDAQITGARSNVVRLPLERKLAVIERVAAGDFGKQLTLAARNGSATETDIDSLLDDLVKLGLIDEEGNEP